MIEAMEKLSKSDKDFYKKISLMRKRKVGGQHFKNVGAARAAQKKSVLSKHESKDRQSRQTIQPLDKDS